MNSNLVKRAATGAVFVAVLVSGVWFGPYTFAGLFFLVSLLALAEFYSLAGKAGYHPHRWLGLLTGACIYLLNIAVFTGFLSSRILTLQLPLILLLFIAELFAKKEKPFTNVLFAAGGIFYVVLAFACFVATGFISGGYNYQLPLGFLLLLWISDTGAYLAGSLFGRHRMLERISPKKTWEGFLGGLLICCSAAAQMAGIFPVMNSLEWMGLALVIVIFGTLGDFVESMFKRSIDIKDSGSLLPGHGGLLDRFDSLLLAAPFAYAYLVLVAFS
ncbi:phosphatidate cytidylyltransferase [Anseongella ginsenosidimutans]|uniref:Phosphatidate cytidylyltransferase n=1 Tax=Anseongella ginsenosidimutans TaxID=496056 RepID=A0A4R3KU53_9SPHI|nr:phosphatidate cytidylyltransferase [Anseongella ginsenosidimutans]QEC51574.1 phosphatidate cytidylyltransferase [Anseongella ginsenosidimutans]TCS88899.1 phosphatidate cytidylyltransferase [Anseongella ginsenosidimutans]